MITIELIDERQSRSEKPAHRTHEYSYQSQDKYYDPVRMLVENQRDDLLRAAHDARLLKTARKDRPAINIRRYLGQAISAVGNLVERSVRRLGYL